MSVLIPGMDMPISCRECRLKMNCDDCEGWECVCVPLQHQIGHLDDLLTDKRRDDCPLVPVPEHGRLGDLDALINKIGENIDKAKDRSYDWWYACTVAYDFALAAPTIIPADHIGDVNEMVTDKEGE